MYTLSIKIWKITTKMLFFIAIFYLLLIIFNIVYYSIEDLNLYK